MIEILPSAKERTIEDIAKEIFSICIRMHPADLVTIKPPCTARDMARLMLPSITSCPECGEEDVGDETTCRTCIIAMHLSGVDESADKEIIDAL